MNRAARSTARDSSRRAGRAAALLNGAEPWASGNEMLGGEPAGCPGGLQRAAKPQGALSRGEVS